MPLREKSVDRFLAQLVSYEQQLVLSKESKSEIPMYPERFVAGEPLRFEGMDFLCDDRLARHAYKRQCAKTAKRKKQLQAKKPPTGINAIFRKVDELASPCYGCQHATRCAAEKLACLDFAVHVEFNEEVRENRTPSKHFYEIVFAEDELKGRSAQHRVEMLHEARKAGAAPAHDDFIFTSPTPSALECRRYARWLLANHPQISTAEILRRYQQRGVSTPSKRQVQSWRIDAMRTQPGGNQ